MTIPATEDLTLPVLLAVGDQQDHSMADVRKALAERFGVSEQELAELIPGSYQKVFSNRVAWAKVHLQGAGLLTSPKPSVLQITNAGLDILKNPPERLEIAYLKQRSKSPGPLTSIELAPLASSETPEEVIGTACALIESQLQKELLERVKKVSSSFFEQLVVELIVRMGYGGNRESAGRAIGKGGDGGVDGVINEDRLGLDRIYLQAKRWQGSVGRPEVQKFVGALQGRHARKGIMLTTSWFTSEAIDFVRHIDARVILIDGVRLAELMLEFDVGVSTARQYSVKRLDLDYFEEE